MVLVPIVLYGLDYVTVLYGGQMNASACNAACRAAAAGPPSGYGAANNTPRNRASTALARVTQAGAIVRMKKTVRIQENVTAPVPSIKYGGPFQGTVSIKTRCDVYPPFLLPFIPKNVVLYTDQTYPWSYVLPSNPTANSGPGAVTPVAGGGGGITPVASNGGGGIQPLMAGPGGSFSGSSGGSSATNDIKQPIADSDP